MEENYKVYKHTSPSGKVYIGITKNQNVEDRWNNGKGYVKNNHFYNAIQKYGWDNFTHEVLFENLSKEEACKKEIELIAEYKSNNFGFGYNKSIGGEGRRGAPQSVSAKQKISIASKQHWNNPIIREKLLQGINNAIKPDNIGELVSDGLKRYYILHPERKELCSKVGKLNKGRKASEETKRKMSIAQKGKIAWNKGKETPPEICRKISESNKGKIMSIEARLKISEANKNKKRTSKCKQQISNSIKNLWKNNEYANHMSIAHKGKIWVTNGVDNRQINPKELETFKLNGFYRGRTLNKRKKE